MSKLDLKTKVSLNLQPVVNGRDRERITMCNFALSGLRCSEMDKTLQNVLLDCAIYFFKSFGKFPYVLYLYTIKGF